MTVENVLTLGSGGRGSHVHLVGRCVLAGAPLCAGMSSALREPCLAGEHQGLPCGLWAAEVQALSRGRRGAR